MQASDMAVKAARLREAEQEAALDIAEERATEANSEVESLREVPPTHTHPQSPTPGLLSMSKRGICLEACFYSGYWQLLVSLPLYAVVPHLPSCLIV